MNTLKTFYVICTLEDHRAPIVHAIGTRAIDADQAEKNIKRLRNDATVIGVVGGAIAKSEDEALRVFFNEGGQPLTPGESGTVYGLLFLALIVLAALIYALVSF